MLLLSYFFSLCALKAVHRRTVYRDFFPWTYGAMFQYYNSLWVIASHTILTYLCGRYNLLQVLDSSIMLRQLFLSWAHRRQFVFQAIAGCLRLGCTNRDLAFPVYDFRLELWSRILNSSLNSSADFNVHDSAPYNSTGSMSVLYSIILVFRERDLLQKCLLNP